MVLIQLLLPTQVAHGGRRVDMHAELRASYRELADLFDGVTA